MYDGHRYDQDRTAPPSGFIDCIRTRDVVRIAFEVMRELKNLTPLETPSVPPRSTDLEKAMESFPPRALGEGLEEKDKQRLVAEHKHYCEQVMARAEAKGENARRLRSTLWAEQLLRRHGRQEHEILRDFNRDVWFVTESAAIDIAEREAQVKAHA